MKKLDINFDMDGVVTDLLQKWIEKINKKFHRKITVADILDWDVEKCPQLQDINKGKVYKIIQRPMFFWDLEPLPGSIEAIAELVNDGHNVKFLTAPAGAQSAYEKLHWTDEHFPNVGHGNVILTKHKTLVRGDVLVDDKGSTVVDYKKQYPDALVMTISYPYNTDVTPDTGILNAGNWDDMETVWKNIVAEVRKKAQE